MHRLAATGFGAYGIVTAALAVDRILPNQCRERLGCITIYKEFPLFFRAAIIADRKKERESSYGTEKRSVKAWEDIADAFEGIKQELASVIVDLPERSHPMRYYGCAFLIGWSRVHGRGRE
jgi:hypothetical protein